jgi:xylulokinase
LKTVLFHSGYCSFSQDSKHLIVVLCDRKSSKLSVGNMANESLYLGFDLSTQQLKCIAINSDLGVRYEAKFDFDKDSNGFNISKGIITNEAEHEVYAPVALWLQALDSILDNLKDQGLQFGNIRGISGAGQQHGSVFWSAEGVNTIGHLNPAKRLEEQLGIAFAHPYSPNWQDTSTQAECDKFDHALGSLQALAQATGSSAHHVRVQKV